MQRKTAMIVSGAVTAFVLMVVLGLIYGSNQLAAAAGLGGHLPLRPGARADPPAPMTLRGERMKTPRPFRSIHDGRSHPGAASRRSARARHPIGGVLGCSVESTGPDDAGSSARAAASGRSARGAGDR